MTYLISFLEYCPFWIFIKIMQLFKFRLRISISSKIISFILRNTPKYKKRVFNNLSLIYPKMSDFEKNKFLKNFSNNLGLTFSEFLFNEEYHKYQAQKRANEAKKKQKNIDVKEIKFRPNIDTHDYNVKMKSVEKFIGEGDKVKVTLRFRGREMAHQDRGTDLLEKIKVESDEFAKVELLPKFEGRQMVMVLAPK